MAVGIIAGVVAGGAALLYLFNKKAEAAEADKVELCRQCVAAARVGRLADIVQHVPIPCDECVRTAEDYYYENILNLQSISRFESTTTDANGATFYNCFHRADPKRSAKSYTPECKMVAELQGLGVSPLVAAAEVQQYKSDLDLIKLKATKAAPLAD